MEIYPLDYQYGQDITWFLVGVDEVVVQFSSGGAIVPSIVANNAQDNQLLIDYFGSLPPSCESDLNPHLDRYMNLGNLRSGTGYLKRYARKGLFSFDMVDPGPGNNSIAYHLVASPQQLLRLTTLPNEVQQALSKFRVEIDFRLFHMFDAWYLPWAALFTDYYVRTQYQMPPPKRKWPWQ